MGVAGVRISAPGRAGKAGGAARREEADGPSGISGGSDSALFHTTMTFAMSCGMCAYCASVKCSALLRSG